MARKLKNLAIIVCAQEVKNNKEINIEQKINEAKRLFSEGSLSEAKEILLALESNAVRGEIFLMLGKIFGEENNFQKAKEYLEKAIRVNSRNPENFSALGILYYKNNNIETAKFYFNEALFLDPADFETNFNLGILARNEGNFKKAIDYFEKAEKKNPGNFILKYNLGFCYHKLGENEKAKKYLAGAIELNPENAEARFLLGSICDELGEKKSALRHFRKARDLDGNNPRYLTNFGNANLYLGNFSEAVRAFEKALTLNPGSSDIRQNLAAAYLNIGEFAKARKIYDEEMQKNPEDATLRFNRALLLLKLGEYDEGFAEYEFRIKSEQKNVLHGVPFWKGESLAGKTIAVLDEQGIGDVIQFVRYLSLLKERGARVILQTKEPLLSLFRKNEIADKIVADCKHTEHIDYKAYLLSLPHLTGANVLKTESYLRATDEVFLPFEKDEKLKVGIIWRGNPKNIYDGLRSIELNVFAKLFDVPNVIFYSFQVDITDKEREMLKEKSVIDLSGYINSFEDTANLLAKMDLAISVDTAFAHLGGAIGKQTWIVIGEQDWRWGTSGENTPWYASVKLFRKSAETNWKSIIEETSRQLRQLAGGFIERKTLILKFEAIKNFSEKKYEEAENLLLRYVKSNSDDYEGFYWLGQLYRIQKQMEKAERYFQEAIKRNPEHKDTNIVLAAIALERSNFEEAEKFYKRVIDKIDEADIINNYAFTLFSLYKFEEAEKYFLDAISKNGIAGYYLNAANNYFRMNKPELAIEFYDKAIELENLAGAHVGKALLYLSVGDFKKGFEEFRWSLRKMEPPNGKGKRWKGESLNGKTIMVYTEQGLGDALFYFRFLPKLKDEGAKVKVVCSPLLKELFMLSPYVDEVSDVWLENFDYYVSLLELPLLLDVKAPEDFIFPDDLFVLDEAKIDEIKRTFNEKKLNVGLVWQTFSDSPTARERSVPTDEIKKIFANKKADFYVLQVDTPPEVEQELLNEFGNVTFVKENFNYLAHLLKALDIVISIDTVILNLAGMIKAQTIGLISQFPDWRWIESQKRKFFPSTLEIVYQKENSWRNAIEKVNRKINLAYEKKVKAEPGQTNLSFEKTLKEIENYLLSGDYYSALIAAENGLKYFPENITLLFKAAYVNQISGKLDDAIFYYGKVLSKEPLNIDALNNIAVAFKDLGKFEEAKKFLSISEKLSPENISTINNFGLLHELKGEFSEAIKYYNKALKINGNFRDALLNKANALMFEYKFDEAIKALNKILAVSPNDVSANYNKAIIYLFSEKFEEGFRLYEWRRKRPEYQIRNFSKPELKNYDLAGKRILVYDEQGYGDTIQFCRFVSLLKENGAFVILQTHAGLTPLLQRCNDVDIAVTRTTLGDPENIEYDFHIPLLSLPAFFGIKNVESISNKFPYIKVNMELKEKYRKELFDESKIKVGLVWEGKKPIYNEHRSMTLEAFEPFIRSFNYTFYSLQQKNVAKRYKKTMEKLNVVDLSEHLHNFDQTAAIIANLDFVVTIDTSIAHLSGALGKKTFVLLSRKADWRWTRGETTPWYPKHVLIRQNKLGNWNSVIEKLIHKVNSFETDFAINN